MDGEGEVKLVIQVKKWYCSESPVIHMPYWLNTDCLLKWSHKKRSLWSTSEELSTLLSIEHHVQRHFPCFLLSIALYLVWSLPLASMGEHCVLSLKPWHLSWGSCSSAFHTKSSLGFASCVCTAAATCSHRWPPQLSPLPQEHWACGSLSTFTEHRLCRRQQRPAAHRPAAPKIGEIHTLLL